MLNERKDQLLNSNLAPSTLVNGWEVFVMDKVFKNGLMVLSILVLGKMEEQMVKENSYTLMEIYMMESGSMIKQTDTDCMFM
jgi:hypothetical protein